MKYLLLLNIIEADDQATTPTAEEVAARMEPWNRFTAAAVEAGAFISGEGLHPSSSATTVRHEENGGRIVSDGPFAETKEQIGGYYLLECADLDDALGWAKKVPVGPGSTVEVRPVLDFENAASGEANAAAQAAG